MVWVAGGKVVFVGVTRDVLYLGPAWLHLPRRLCASGTFGRQLSATTGAMRWGEHASHCQTRLSGTHLATPSSRHRSAPGLGGAASATWAASLLAQPCCISALRARPPASMRHCPTNWT